jgi:hypothetical protein
VYLWSNEKFGLYCYIKHTQKKVHNLTRIHRNDIPNFRSLKFIKCNKLSSTNFTQYLDHYLVRQHHFRIFKIENIRENAFKAYLKNKPPVYPL